MNSAVPEQFKHLDWDFIATELCMAILGDDNQVALLDHEQSRINSSGTAVFKDENGDELFQFSFISGDGNGTEIFNIAALEGK